LANCGLGTYYYQVKYSSGISAGHAAGNLASCYWIPHDTYEHQPIDWTPVDNVSRIILDVLFKKEVLPPILNVVHPKPIPWSYMINTISDSLQQNNVCPKLPLVSWAEWMSKVEKIGGGRLDQNLLENLV
jgi:hypothetical protein